MAAEQTVKLDGVSASGGVLPTSYQYVAVAPGPSAILAGSVEDDSAVITIPANSVWFGYISISASQTGAGTSTVTVSTVSGTATPAPGVNLASVTLVTTTAVDAASNTYSTPFFHVYSGPSGTALDVTIDGSASVSIEAYGYGKAA